MQFHSGIEELHDLNVSIRRASKKQSRLRRRQECNWNVTLRTKMVALSVYLQSKYSEPAAVAYVMHHKLKGIKRKAGFDEPMETLCEECPIRDWFLQVSLDRLEQIGVNPATKKDWSIFCEAQTFLSEKKTFDWLRTQNISKGRPVTAVELADSFLGFLHGGADGKSTSDHGIRLRHLQDHHFERKGCNRGVKLGSTKRKWCVRFKKKWNVRHGQMMERESMDIKEVQQKVGQLLKTFCCLVFFFCL